MVQGFAWTVVGKDAATVGNEALWTNVCVLCRDDIEREAYLAAGRNGIHPAARSLSCTRFSCV
jgi:hypothetical protein